ncbi:MAG: histidinol dehydrogenase, partial [Acidimicrobiia bacterium]|nr:histidinol dehydrogenase [Acidimicrobiia bacterium]
AAVRAILADVEARGDEALRDLTARFDGVELDDLRVPPPAIAAALEAVEPALRAALEEAAANIGAFHQGQLHAPHVHERNGVRVLSYRVPVDRAGLYVPGGRAVYPSTVLMTAVPARVAGVGEVALCVPPDKSTGGVPLATLAAAAVAGVDEVYAVGGAQAIAALAFGTESIGAVDVIVGPGNAYVAVAKREVAGRGRVAIPSAFAGPSEVVVVADASVPADFAAIDLVVQAEHGPGGLAWLLCWSEDVLEAVDRAVERLVAEAPRREDILATLGGNGYAVLCDTPAQAMAVANLIAPEHLELLCAAADELVPLVRHAGAVFCGPLAPASIGDYLAGPSHVLPTFGSARFGSALTVDDFLKHLHVVTVGPQGFERAAPHVVALARAEGLEAHAQSILLRQAAR